MATNLSAKKNQTSLQVLKTLKVLLEGDYTMSEIVDKLNERENVPVFNSSVVRKYINTCRVCGISIPKIQNKYCVSQIFFGLQLNESDLFVLRKMIDIARNKFSNNIYEKFRKVVTKISKYSNREIGCLDICKKEKNVLLFEEAIESERKIQLLLLDKTLCECTPLEIIQHRRRTFFNILTENGEKLVCSDKVILINVLQDRTISKKEEVTVLFKLRGGLAKRYTPREHETVEIDKEPDTILVANKGENKEILFARLLRYDSCCEIISPKSYRNEMKELLKNMLSNYGV